MTQLGKKVPEYLVILFAPFAMFVSRLQHQSCGKCHLYDVGGNMRRLMLAVVLLCCALLPNFAYAEGATWARVVRDDTHLFATEDCSKQMFALEKSYYVEILETLDKTYFVRVDCNDKQFPAICGYVLKNEVRLFDDVPQNPLYPTIRVVVNTDSAVVRLAPTPSAEVVVVATNTQKVCYYGKVTNYGKLWYYVYFAGDFGYILAEDVTSPNVPLHHIPIDIPQDVPVVAPPADDVVDQTPQEVITPTAEIILTVFVSLLALAITFSLFLPVKNKKQVFDGDI